MEALHVENNKTHQKPLTRLEIIKEDLIKLALLYFQSKKQYVV